MFEALSLEDIRQQERERLLRELNTCHGPGRGHPCVGGSTGVKNAHIKRRTKATSRAKSIVSRASSAMLDVGGNVSRALSLRKRMDVAGPLVTRAKQTSFLGTLLRKGAFRGKKR